MRGAVVLLALVLTSCAGRGTAFDRGAPTSGSPQSAQAMSLIGRFGMAHACPVLAPGPHIITAAHVAVTIPRGYGFKQVPMSYVYQQGDKSGFVSASTDHPPVWFVDLGWLDLKHGDMPDFHSLAATLEVGSQVHWFEFDYSSTGKMLSIERREADVTQIIAGHFVIDDDPDFGSSGGCFFNDQDEVVGIVSFGLRSAGARGKWTGVGILFTKAWNW